MATQPSTWLWTLSVAAVTGAVSVYMKTKTAAIRHLGYAGVFKQAQEERFEALRQLPESESAEALKQAEKQAKNIALEEENENRRDKWVDSAAVRKVNQEYRDKKHDIIQEHGADHFSGAWNILSTEEKNRTLGFSAINSIIAGGLTYAITNAASKARARRNSTNGKGNSGCGTAGSSGCSTTHSHGGGHGCGVGCSGGCGGGCGGGG